MGIGDYQVVLSRHVLWAMTDPADAVARWARLLAPGGIIVLLEGRWSGAAGLTAAQTRDIVLQVRTHVSITPLADAVYWGKTITDERAPPTDSASSYPSALRPM